MRPPRQVGRLFDKGPGADAQFRREGRQQHAASAYDEIAERGENALGRIESQRKSVQILGASPIVRALLLLIGVSPRNFVKKGG